MRVFIAACLTAVMLMLLVVVVPAEPEGRIADTAIMFALEAECPCGLDGCTAHAGFASDHDIESEDAEGRVVLKLPIETVGNESTVDKTRVASVHGTVTDVPYHGTGVEIEGHVLKLPREAAGNQNMNDSLIEPIHDNVGTVDFGSGQKVEVLNVGAMA